MVRYGLDGNLIDFGIEEEKPARDLLRELLERVEPQARKLNAQDQLSHVYTILERGTSADRQVAAWQGANEDMTAVVDAVIQETEKIA